MIEVGARAEGGETVFFVKDNGVGFDMNTSTSCSACSSACTEEEFTGTGIGLAIVHGS